VNGAILKASFRTLPGEIGSRFGECVSAWKREGWTLQGGGRDFAPDFIRINPQDSFRRKMTSGLLRIHLFRRGETWRVLGLFQSPRDGTVYSALVDVPEKALGEKPEDLGGPAGLGVPEGVTGATECSAYGFEGHVWRSSRPVSDVEWLLSWTQRKGICLKPLAREGPEKTFVASKGSKKYLVAVFPDPTGSTATWCTLP
jgi:hypothetical protein